MAVFVRSFVVFSANHRTTGGRFFVCRFRLVLGLVLVWVLSPFFSVAVSIRRECRDGVTVAPSRQNQRGFAFFSCTFWNSRRAGHVAHVVHPRRCFLSGKSYALPNLFSNLLRASPAERKPAVVSRLATLLHPPLVGGFVPIAQQGCRQKIQRKSRRIARVRALVRAQAFAGGGSRVSRAGASQSGGA